MSSETKDEKRSSESSLAAMEKTFNDSLAQYTRSPKSQTFQALREAESRLKLQRLAAGQPTSDLQQRVQQALMQARPRK